MSETHRLKRIGLLRNDFLNYSDNTAVKENEAILLNTMSHQFIKKSGFSTLTKVMLQTDGRNLCAAIYNGHLFLGIWDKKTNIISFNDDKEEFVHLHPESTEAFAYRTLAYENNPQYLPPSGSPIFQAWKQTEPYLERAAAEMDRFEELRESSSMALSSDKFLEHDAILNHIALEYEAEMAIREYCREHGIAITSSHFDENGTYYLNGEPFAYLREDGKAQLFQAKTDWQRYFVKRELDAGFPAESVYYELQTLQTLLPLFMEISPFTENEPTVIRLIESSLWKDPALAKEQFEKIQKFVQSSRTPVQEEELSQEIQNFFDKSL